MKSVDELLAQVREATPGPNDVQRAAMRAGIRRAIAEPAPAAAPAPAPAPAPVHSGRAIVVAIALATIAIAVALWIAPRVLPRPAEPVVHSPPSDSPGVPVVQGSSFDSPATPPARRGRTGVTTDDLAAPALKKQRVIVTDYGSRRFAPSVDDLYDRADAALARNDLPAARAALEELIATAPPTAPRVDVARLDLARLALRMDDRGTARRHAEALATTTREPALREAAHHLLCRVVAASEQAACAAAFLHAFPASPRVAEMLALEAANTLDPCAARPLLRAYVDRFPDGAYAADAQKRLATATCTTP